MIFLRTLFLSSCVGCVVLTAWFARWEAHAVKSGHIWVIDLPRSPLWAPPPAPTFEHFRKTFAQSEDFPAQGEEVRIVRHLRTELLPIELLMWLWLVSLFCGFFYWLTRGDELDFALHLGEWIGIGISAGVASCFLLWILIGGWGPPYPPLFAMGGFLSGIVLGILRFQGYRRSSDHLQLKDEYLGQTKRLETPGRES